MSSGHGAKQQAPTTKPSIATHRCEDEVELEAAAPAEVVVVAEDEDIRGIESPRTVKITVVNRVDIIRGDLQKGKVAGTKSTFVINVGCQIIGPAHVASLNTSLRHINAFVINSFYVSFYFFELTFIYFLKKYVY
ncbi:hypothetical protein HanPI659440_Chr03g0109141 [Helianthus annuus]|nr:hypothetical protein HanPI659440_Chr03g0109141 [Helianthus annuus]